MALTLSSLDPRRHTNPIIWCIATICAILVILVILATIVIFIMYKVTKPEAPSLVVSNARLDDFGYNQWGFLTTQVTLVVTSKNDNTRASVNFYRTSINLVLGGTTIAHFTLSASKLIKNSSTESSYTVVSKPLLPLTPLLRDIVDKSLKQDRLTLHLDGEIRTKWKFLFLSSANVWIDMKCPLHFVISTKEIIGPQCKSMGKV